MWLPVLESKRLGRDPVRVTYWGSPVVLFRTESGKIGALEDSCPHRAVRLSSGSVQGESLRCGFHHLRFDASGACTDAPTVLGADDAFRRGCTVRQYFVREALGLIFISVEDGPEAPFWIDDGTLSAQDVITRSVEIEGDVIAWMDHVGDVSHAMFHHGALFLTPPKGSLSVSPPGPFTEDVRFPTGEAGVREVPTRTITYEPSRPPPLHLRILQAGGLLPFLLRLFSRRATTLRVDLQQTFFSPGSHELIVRMTSGSAVTQYSVKAFYNQVAPGRIRGTAIGSSLNPPRWPWKSLELLAFFRLAVAWQVLKEDAPFLADAASDARRFRLAPADRDIVSLRALIARYLREKSNLYAPDSLIHSLRHHPGLEVPPEAAPPASRSQPLPVLVEQVTGGPS
jgi:nitrite reductase/ring-hydroxylating ferredoxin subunit